MPGLYDEFGKLEFVFRCKHEWKAFQKNTHRKVEHVF